MQRKQNEGGGQSVILVPGDDLGMVPRSHRRLITSELREAFADPISYFLGVADRCPFPAMAAWLRALAAGGDWELVLHQGDPKAWTAAAIRWFSDDDQCAEVTPASGLDSSGRPPALRRYDSPVDAVSWMPFGLAGGLQGQSGHTPLTDFYYTYQGADIDPSRTFVLGTSYGGDMLIYTDDDRGGWLCHENGKIHLLGTIEWVYAELLANRSPDFDYNWA